MYSRLTSLLQSKADGKIKMNEKNIVFLYEGVFEDSPLTVKVIRISGQKKNFVVEYKGENVIFKSEEKTVRYLTGIFDPSSAPKISPRKIEPVKHAEEENIYKQVLDGYKLVFVDDKGNSQNEDTSVSGINEKGRDFQVGYEDPDMPEVLELENLAKGLTPEVSSNWRSGCINNALSELGVRDRYRLIYIFDGYFCYDKKKKRVITLKELFKIIPNELITKYDLGPKIIQPEVEE